jgi:hypothetical protein
VDLEHLIRAVAEDEERRIRTEGLRGAAERFSRYLASLGTPESPATTRPRTSIPILELLPFAVASLPVPQLGVRPDEAPPAEAESVEEQPLRRWRYRARPEDFEWPAGRPDEVSGQTALIEAEWYASGNLVVGVTGFLRLGRGAALAVRWLAADAAVRSTGQVVDSIAAVELVDGPPEGPQSGDLLELHHTWQSSAGGWDVRLASKFG